MSIPAPDYYRVLSLDSTATTEEVKKRWLNLCRLYHPDLNPGKEDESHKIMLKINEAYRVLHDPEKRKQYDASSTGLGAPAPRNDWDFTPPSWWPQGGVDLNNEEACNDRIRIILTKLYGGIHYQNNGAALSATTSRSDTIVNYAVEENIDYHNSGRYNPIFDACDLSERTFSSKMIIFNDRPYEIKRGVFERVSFINNTKLNKTTFSKCDLTEVVIATPYVEGLSFLGSNINGLKLSQAAADTILSTPYAMDSHTILDARSINNVKVMVGDQEVDWDEYRKQRKTLPAQKSTTPVISPAPSLPLSSSIPIDNSEAAGNPVISKLMAFLGGSVALRGFAWGMSDTKKQPTTEKESWIKKVAPWALVAGGIALTGWGIIKSKDISQQR